MAPYCCSQQLQRAYQVETIRLAESLVMLPPVLHNVNIVQ